MQRILYADVSYGEADSFCFLNMGPPNVTHILPIKKSILLIMSVSDNYVGFLLQRTICRPSLRQYIYSFLYWSFFFMKKGDQTLLI